MISNGVWVLTKIPRASTCCRLLQMCLVTDDSKPCKRQTATDKASQLLGLTMTCSAQTMNHKICGWTTMLNHRPVKINDISTNYFGNFWNMSILPQTHRSRIGLHPPAASPGTCCAVVSSSFPTATRDKAVFKPGSWQPTHLWMSLLVLPCFPLFTLCYSCIMELRLNSLAESRYLDHKQTARCFFLWNIGKC